MNSTNWLARDEWVFIAQMAEHCGANARLLLSTGLIHKRSQFAQGHVFQAVWWVPSRFVPDTPLRIVISCNWSVLRPWMQVMVLERIQLYSTKYIKNEQMIQNCYSGYVWCDVRSILIFFRRPIVLCFKAISQCSYRSTYLLLSTVFAPPKPTYSAVHSTSPLKVEVSAQNVARNTFWAFCRRMRQYGLLNCIRHFPWIVYVQYQYLQAVFWNWMTHIWGATFYKRVL